MLQENRARNLVIGLLRATVGKRKRNLIPRRPTTDRISSRDIRLADLIMGLGETVGKIPFPLRWRYPVVGGGENECEKQINSLPLVLMVPTYADRKGPSKIGY